MLSSCFTVKMDGRSGNLWRSGLLSYRVGIDSVCSYGNAVSWDLNVFWTLVFISHIPFSALHFVSGIAVFSLYSLTCNSGTRLLLP